MNKKTSLILVVLLGLAASTAGIFVVLENNSKKEGVQMVTGYEDAAGWIYRCSKPVAAKNQGVTYGNGTPSLTPIEPAEANKYCRRMGIE